MGGVRDIVPTAVYLISRVATDVFKERRSESEAEGLVPEACRNSCGRVRSMHCESTDSSG